MMWEEGKKATQENLWQGGREKTEDTLMGNCKPQRAPLKKRRKNPQRPRSNFPLFIRGEPPNKGC